jgi:hypothetical protein
MHGIRVPERLSQRRFGVPFPLAFRGALSMSVTMRFAGRVGSTAKKILSCGSRMHLDANGFCGQRRPDESDQQRRSRHNRQHANFLVVPRRLLGLKMTSHGCGARAPVG